MPLYGCDAYVEMFACDLFDQSTVEILKATMDGFLSIGPLALNVPLLFLPSRALRHLEPHYGEDTQKTMQEYEAANVRLLVARGDRGGV